MTQPGSRFQDGEGEPATGIPHQTYRALFLRFLRFGSLAWGGPVAQIGMLQRELVLEERWIAPERFNRALAVYQVLPGPEASELCVYFGMLARGRLGGFLAGLGFLLPGFVLMFAMSWLYVSSQGALNQGLGAVFLGLQAAVVALIARALHRIGSHALKDAGLFGLAVVALAASLAGVHFAINLAAAGAFYVALRRGRRGLCAAVAIAWLAAALLALCLRQGPAEVLAGASSAAEVPLPLLFYAGLKAGLLTFGGAYTVIPFLQRDAVVHGAWMTNEQFLDGLALGGILPAPLIIFATFVGYLGGRALGAFALTTGIFLPAFGFTLAAHDHLERATQKPGIHQFLDGITAGVVGLIAATSVQLAPAALGSLAAVAIFAGSLVLLYTIEHRLAVLLVMGSAALAGALAF